MFTIDWAWEDKSSFLDTNFSEDPEHKCAHMFRMDEGTFFAYPNNRIIWYDDAYMEKRLNELCKGIANAHGAEIKIDFDLVNKYPPTINSKEETKFAAHVAKDLVGDDKVITDIDPSMGGEDFSYLLEKKPGSYLYLGQGDNEHSAHLHTTKYDFNDNLLPIGVNFWVDLVQKYFSK